MSITVTKDGDNTVVSTRYTPITHDIKIVEDDGNGTYLVKIVL